MISDTVYDGYIPVTKKHIEKSRCKNKDTAKTMDTLVFF